MRAGKKTAFSESCEQPALATGCFLPRISMKSQDDSCFDRVLPGRPDFTAFLQQLMPSASVFDNFSSENEQRNGQVQPLS